MAEVSGAGGGVSTTRRGRQRRRLLLLPLPPRAAEARAGGGSGPSHRGWCQRGLVRVQPVVAASGRPSDDRGGGGGLRRRLLQHRAISAVLISISDLGNDEVYDIFGEVPSRGLSSESLKKLPCHVIANGFGDVHREKTLCTICLQDIEVGDTVRSLPICSHTFHLLCVDKWLVKHGSCPVCRQDV